jgi:choline kinase
MSDQLRAIILAAGRGSRMKGQTEHQPKCLTHIAGQPLLQWQTSALRRGGAELVGIVRGYRAEMLDDAALVKFENPRWAETNMVASLVCASAWLENSVCVVSYSDIAYHPEIVAALAHSRGEIAITFDRQWQKLWGARYENPLNDAETFQTDSAGNLVSIGAKAQSLAEVQGQYMGLLKFMPVGWAKVRSFIATLTPLEQDKLHMTGLLNRLLGTGVPIATIPVDGRWCEVDAEQDLRAYESELAKPEKWSHDWRW